MSIDTYVGIRHENVPADRTNDDDLCVEVQKGCELITRFVVKKSVSYICTVSTANKHKHQSHPSYTDVSAEAAKIKTSKKIRLHKNGPNTQIK